MDHRTPVFEVQITQIDYSLNPPDSLDNSSLPKVPVLRIYGASSAGKKCCLHIHQVYPYFLVEYTGKMNPGSGELMILYSGLCRADESHSETLRRSVD